jgi:hypothetical protein
MRRIHGPSAGPQLRFLRRFESQTRSNWLFLSHNRSSIRAQPAAASPVDEVDDVITEPQLPTNSSRSKIHARTAALAETRHAAGAHISVAVTPNQVGNKRAFHF